MKIYEMLDKLGILPAYDDVVVRILSEDGETHEEFEIESKNIGRDFSGKTHIDVHRKSDTL